MALKHADDQLAAGDEKIDQFLAGAENVDHAVVVSLQEPRENDRNESREVL